MLGRTHFFIGTAAALAVLQPQTVPVLVTGAGAAAIGSLIVNGRIRVPFYSLQVMP